jgi:hypothetical protein
MPICLYKELTPRTEANTVLRRATMPRDLDLSKLRASEIVRRRTEEKRAEAFFPLRAPTTAADPKRDARAARKEGEP